MIYPEWADKVQMVDLKNRIAKCYKLDDDSVFYVEPGFYKALQALRNIYPSRYPEVIKAMEKMAQKNPVTVFAGDADAPLVDVPDAMVFSVVDVCDAVGILLEDKSRGSDYGD